MEVFYRSYKPRWGTYFLFSVLIHIFLTLVLFLYPRNTSFDVKVKEVKINLISRANDFQNVNEVTTVTSTTKKDTTKKDTKVISKSEVDNIVFEVVAPKLSKVVKDDNLGGDSLGGKSVVEDKGGLLIGGSSTDKFGEVGKVDREDKGSETKQIKGEVKGFSDVSGKENYLGSKEVLSLPTAKIDAGEVSGNIVWIKGSTRKVIEWYSPDIPPYLLRKAVEVVVTFYIEPSGFVSRVEIAKTSGEQLVDEVIYKTMKRIRFSPAQSSTVANVTLQIIPQ
ncbi:MAG: energy transducer TonB [Brevinematia bacterium]